jgi:hypothetical protein
MTTTPIRCSGTATGNPVDSIHPPGGTPPVLGYLTHEPTIPPSPTALWGYLCAACAKTWNEARAKDSSTHPWHFLVLKDPKTLANEIAQLAGGGTTL